MDIDIYTDDDLIAVKYREFATGTFDYSTKYTKIWLTEKTTLTTASDKSILRNYDP